MAAENTAEKQRGRPFVKGMSGNPRGKPRGARHKVTIAAEKLMADEADAIVQSVINAAKTGDIHAARIILDRIVPIRKGRPLLLDFPPLSTAADVMKAYAALVAAMADGELTPDEAATVASVLGMQRQAIETAELDARLRAIEERIGSDA